MSCHECVRASCISELCLQSQPHSPNQGTPCVCCTQSHRRVRGTRRHVPLAMIWVVCGDTGGRPVGLRMCTMERDSLGRDAAQGAAAQWRRPLAGHGLGPGASMGLAGPLWGLIVTNSQSVSQTRLQEKSGHLACRRFADTAWRLFRAVVEHCSMSVDRRCKAPASRVCCCCGVWVAIAQQAVLSA